MTAPMDYGFIRRPPTLRAQDDTVRGHVGNAFQLLLCEQSAATPQERALALDGARKRLRMALELIDDQARSEHMARQLMGLV